MKLHSYQKCLNIVKDDKLRLGDKPVTSRDYYNEVSKTVASLAKFIDEKIKKKYFSK